MVGGRDVSDLLGQGVLEFPWRRVLIEVRSRLVGVNAGKEDVFYGVGRWVYEFEEESLSSALLDGLRAQDDATSEGVASEVDEGIFRYV